MTQHQPNLADGVLAIHAVITRGIHVVGEQAALRASAAPEQLSADGRGFAAYVLALAQVTSSHHLTEDELAFPYFEDKIPDMPFEKLAGDHRRMVPLIERLQTAATIESGPLPARDVELAAGELETIWGPHHEIEERYLGRERLARILDPAEDVQISRKFAEHSQRNAQPDYIVLPFLLYNVPEAQRWVFADALPEMVREELLPKVWRPHWEPMAPFLLDPPQAPRG